MRKAALSEITAQRDNELRAQEERVHSLHVDKPHTLYTATAYGSQALPYDTMTPTLPVGLRSVRFQKPVSYASSQVVDRWGNQGHERAKVRTAWGLDQPRTERVREFLAAHGIRETGPHVVLWSRRSGKQGERTRSTTPAWRGCGRSSTACHTKLP